MVPSLVISLAVLILVALSTANRRDPRFVVQIPENQGGRRATRPYPWMVSLQIERGHKCGGTLIRVCESCEESDMVLTAAHCITKGVEGRFWTKSMISEQFEVVPGILSLSQEKARRYAVKNMSYFPDWDPRGAEGLKHDIALIQTTEPIKYSDTIRAIDLQTATEDFVAAGTQCEVAGWGLTSGQSWQSPDHLQEIDVTIANGSACLSDHRDAKYFYDDMWMTCAESKKGESTTCQGDSGSALVCPSEYGPRAIGVVSFGGEKCGDEKKSVYTTIQPHLTWIYATVYENSQSMDKDFLWQQFGWK